jgi:hypothetical protein
MSQTAEPAGARWYINGGAGGGLGGDGGDGGGDGGGGAGGGGKRQMRRWLLPGQPAWTPLSSSAQSLQ